MLERLHERKNREPKSSSFIGGSLYVTALFHLRRPLVKFPFYNF